MFTRPVSNSDITDFIIDRLDNVKTPDCHVYSKNFLDYMAPIHKEIFAQTPFLRAILASSNAQCPEDSPILIPDVDNKELHQMVHFLYYGEILDVKDTRKIIKNLIDILGFPDDMDLTISCNVCNQKISYQGEDVLVCTGCNMEVQTRPPTKVPNNKAAEDINSNVNAQDPSTDVFHPNAPASNQTIIAFSLNDENRDDTSILNMFSSDEEDDQSDAQSCNDDQAINDDDSESLENRIRNDFPSDITEQNVDQIEQEIFESPKPGIIDPAEPDQIKENRSENVSSPKPGTIEQNVDQHDQIEQAMLGIFESPKPGIAGDVPPNNDNLESLEHSIRSDFTTDNITTEKNVHHQDQIKENRSENVSSPKPGTSASYFENRKVTPLKIILPKPQTKEETENPKRKNKRKAESDGNSSKETNVTKKPRKNNVNKVKCKKCGQRIRESTFMIHYMPHFDDNGFAQPVESFVDGENKLDCPFHFQCGFRRKSNAVHVTKAHIFKEHCLGEFLSREGVSSLNELYEPANDIIILPPPPDEN